jgi:hypothetical protein
MKKDQKCPRKVMESNPAIRRGRNVNKPINRTHPLSNELLDYELQLIAKAIVKRSSHLASVDQLDHLDSAPKQRKKCPTNKRKFRDKREADKVRHLIVSGVDRFEVNSYKNRFNLKRSYLCGCGFWHHTSQADRFKPEPLNAA